MYGVEGFMTVNLPTTSPSERCGLLLHPGALYINWYIMSHLIYWLVAMHPVYISLHDYHIATLFKQEDN